MTTEGIVTHRRICWPNPDATCLEGGCAHCEANRFRSVRAIECYARRVGTVPSRYVDKPKDALRAFDYGLRSCHESLLRRRKI